MHTDESKRFDKRNIESNLRKGVVTLKDYDAYLQRLPDATHKVFIPEEEPGEEEIASKAEEHSKKKGVSKKH